jgi:hemolysin III
VTGQDVVGKTANGQSVDGKSGVQAEVPPLLRGWLHVGAFVAWLIGGPFLIAAAPDGESEVALSVYVLAMLIMFGTSASLHRIRWSAPMRRRIRRADHSAIFIGIAGTSTGVACLALTGWPQVVLLSVVWGGALVGILVRQAWLDAPQWAVAVPYVVVGWSALIVAPELVHSLGWTGFALILVAGIAYTTGALVYARKRPDPWPDVFGFHEVFHACTVIGAGLFAYLIAFIALPRH